MDIVERIKSYCQRPENRDVAMLVTGYKPNTGEVELTQKNETGTVLKQTYVSVDDLEKYGFDVATFSLKQPQVTEEPIAQVTPTAQITPEPQVTLQPEVQSQPVAPSTPSEPAVTEDTADEPAPVKETTNVTLNDIKTLVELNNKDTLDNILKQIATTQTGEVDMNTIMGIVSNNSINSTIKALNENRPVSTELYKYDKVCNSIAEEESSMQPIDINLNINNGFNNLMVFIEAAKLYGINYTDEQVNTAKQNYVNSVNNGIQIAPSAQIATPETNATSESVKDSEKAGFADVFILAIIVIVYAVIIINLIMKLK